MKKLIIETKFPKTTADLMKAFNLLEERDIEIVKAGFIVARHPDDAISQELYLWFALAHGCGLVGEYRLDMTTKG